MRQQQEQAEKEELERREREKERLEELERQKEEEHRRKQEEFEDRARMIQADMGYITNENKGALDSQAQSFGIKGQSPEDQKRQAYGAKAIKTSEIKKPKEPVKTEKTENEKESKKEKKEDKKSNSEKEDKSEEDKKEDEKPTEKDKKTEKQTADALKSHAESKDENSNKLKSSKQTRADKVKPTAPTGSSQQSSLQTPTKSLKRQKAPSKKTTAKKKPSNNPDNLKAVSQKTKTPKTTASQIKSPAPAQFSEKAPISSFAGNIINACPISMPQIKSAVVYQSVEAPQIEEMEKQEFQPYPDIPRFKSYDLVMGKPAGILVELNTFRMDKNKEFALDLRLGGKNDFDCFHSPLDNKIMEQGREKSCFFKSADLKKSRHKFIPLYMNAEFLKKERSIHKVQVNLYPRGYKKYNNCREIVDFNIKIIKTHDLELGFTRIKGNGSCFASNNINTGYDPTPIKKVKAFVRSNEVQFYIQSMFPIKNVLSELLKYKWNGISYDYIHGTCNNNTGKKTSKQMIDLLEDIRVLEYIRASLSYDKLVAIVPESYFVFHRGKKHDSVGFIVSPKWDWRWFAFWSWKTDFLGGSWNIAFVHEKELNSGTVAHELAHTLGEEKEHYESAGEFCRRFKGSPYKPCHTYTVEKALDTWKESGKLIFQFVENKFSIMNNESGIKNLWILRDTFQKVFAILSKKAVIPPDEKLHAHKSLYYRKERRSSLKVVVSGFYDKKEQAFFFAKDKT